MAEAQAKAKAEKESAPAMCSAGCGFFAGKEYDGMCSSCFRKARG